MCQLENLKPWVTEMFKVKIGCDSDIMEGIFEIENGNYSFRHDFLIKRHNIQLVFNVRDQPACLFNIALLRLIRNKKDSKNFSSYFIEGVLIFR